MDRVHNHPYPFDLSVVLPVYNEEDNIAPLHAELTSVLDDLDLRYEIIYVDDGSQDRSAERVIALAEAHPETVRVVSFAATSGRPPRSGGSTRARRDHRVDGRRPAERSAHPADARSDGRRVRPGQQVAQASQDRAITRKLPSRVANR